MSTEAIIAASKAYREAMQMLPERMDSPEAHVLVIAAGLQESGLTERIQRGEGPARGLWQFELIGVEGVLRHHSSDAHARRVCELRMVRTTVGDVWRKLETDDILAAAFARLALWNHPDPLPAIGDVGSAWAYYLATWRPGKPHPERWPANYTDAVRHARPAV